VLTPEKFKCRHVFVLNCYKEAKDLCFNKAVITDVINVDRSSSCLLNRHADIVDKVLYDVDSFVRYSEMEGIPVLRADFFLQKREFFFKSSY